MLGQKALGRLGQRRFIGQVLPFEARLVATDDLTQQAIRLLPRHVRGQGQPCRPMVIHRTRAPMRFWRK